MPATILAETFAALVPITSTDSTRQNLACIHVKDGCATATDGHALVQRAVARDCGEGMIPARAVKVPRKASTVSVEDIPGGQVRVDVVSPAGTLSATVDNPGTYPATDAVIRDALAGVAAEGTRTVYLDAALLARVAAALDGGRYVRIAIPATKGAPLVVTRCGEAPGESRDFAIVMPAAEPRARS